MTRTALMIALAMVPALAWAHSGGTDARGCHHDRETGGYHCHTTPAQQAREARAELQRLEARQRAWRAVQRGESLEEINAALRDGVSFHGYACTDDCSGHQAGYEWAEENGIESPDDCGGNSQSFIEGCEAWAEANE